MFQLRLQRSFTQTQMKV